MPFVAGLCCSSLRKFSALLSSEVVEWNHKKKRKKRGRSRNLHNELIWLQWSDWRLAMHPAAAQWATVAVDWPPAAWTPFCRRTKREFTLFSWICIVLLPLFLLLLLDTEVITQVYRALNNGLIDGTLIIGPVVYWLGLLAEALGWQNWEKKQKTNSLHISIHTQTSSAQHKQPFTFK